MTLLKRKDIFTEEDKELSKDLNADPLGFQMIWTYFGQQIYRNKINSATFDIRNFNLNLFNHFVIYKLEQQNKLPLEKNRKNIEKILILLENLLIWSWKENKNEFDKKGLTGTSNAEQKWKSDTINIDLNSKREDLEIVQNQHIYGINGRYKGSFINMDFFDSDYQYNQDKMDEVEAIISKNEFLNNLFNDVYNWLSEDRKIDTIPTSSYTNVFGKNQHKEISKYTKDFWLTNLGFDTDNAKIFYDLIDIENKIQDIKDLKDLFLEASQKSINKHFENILHIEPIMAFIEVLFEYILLLDGYSHEEVPKKYFKPIHNFDFEQFKLDNSSSIYQRLNDLSNIKDVQSLIAYHTHLMNQRDKLPWVEIKDNNIKVLMIKQGDIEEYKNYLDKTMGNLEDIKWQHSYYYEIVMQIKESLE